MRIETNQDVIGLLQASKALAVVSAWQGLGLFETLRDGPKHIESLPADRRALVR